MFSKWKNTAVVFLLSILSFVVLNNDYYNPIVDYFTLYHGEPLYDPLGEIISTFIFLALFPSLVIALTFGLSTALTEKKTAEGPLHFGWVFGFNLLLTGILYLIVCTFYLVLPSIFGAYNGDGGGWAEVILIAIILPAVPTIVLLFSFIPTLFYDYAKLRSIVYIFSRIVLVIALIVCAISTLYKINTCDNYTGAICAGKKAAKTNNPALCDKVTSWNTYYQATGQMRCYMEVSKAMPDVKYCTKVKPTEEDFEDFMKLREQCVTSAAIALKNSALCAEIKVASQNIYYNMRGDILIGNQARINEINQRFINDCITKVNTLGIK